ncbi:DUF998 domain-containing protein [Halosimplex salinum]|uniref:DUF998 domain-containing protein n=1 Tax=Halosimplex salinum TaxID=1710538 RepID=UPI0019D1AE29|nr:DUF998 domain-containing protein [Halosimplex salinum]
MSQVTTYERTAARVRETMTDSRTVAGILFLALSAQFMTVIMLAAAMAPGYDFGAAAISDLGVIPETALLFNTSLAVVGILDLVGGYFYYRTHGKRWLLAVFTLAGVGAVGAALFPLDTGGVHSLFALVAFVFFNLEAIGSATDLSGVMRFVSVVAGTVGLVFVVLMVVGDAGNPAAFGPINHGGTERMMVYPVMIWMIALSGYLFGTPARVDAPTRRGS